MDSPYLWSMRRADKKITDRQIMDQIIKSSEVCRETQAIRNFWSEKIKSGTPVLCTWLIKVSGGNVWMPAYYLIVSCIIAILTAYFIPETYKKELD